MTREQITPSEALFDDFVSTYMSSQRLDTSRLHPQIGGVIDEFKIMGGERIRAMCETEWIREAVEPAHLDVYSDPNINAFVVQHEGLHLIGVSVGAVLGLTEIFPMLLSHPDVLPQVGNPKLEKKRFVDISAGFPWVAGHPRSHDFTEPVCWIEYAPIDSVRFDYAIRLSWYALEFLFWHEFGHLSGRHLEFCRDRFHTIRLVEVDPGPQQIWAKYSRVLEFFADKFAVNFGLSHAPWYEETGGSLEQLASQTDEWLFAVGVLFRLFDNARGSEDPDHPHPTLRHLFFFANARDIATARGKLEAAHALETAWARSIPTIHNIWTGLKIPGNCIRTQLESSELEALYDRQIQDVRELQDELPGFSDLSSDISP